MHTRAMAAIVMLGLICTGCATTYDPLRGRAASTGVNKYCEPHGRAYEDGVRCAETVRNAYVEAMVDDAVTSDRVAMALIPLGAAAIGLGVSGVSGAPITGLALGGAAIYGGGRWLTSQERRQVFGTGAEACQCVIAASGPLKVPPPLQEALNTASRDLGAAVAALEAERRTVQADVALSATPLGRELLKAADEVLAEARSAQQRAAALQGRIAAAGDLIVSAVQSVRIAVTKAAVGTAQDLRDLPEFLKSTVYAHRRLVRTFEAVFEEIARLGLAGAIHSYQGIYAFRPIRGINARLSLHAFGAAIDLNAETNPLGQDGDMSLDVVEVFRHFGFRWGGDFAGRKDPMHFQYATGY